MNRIHPTAIIEPGAQIHPTARVGPYCIVESGAVIGPDCHLDSHARVNGLARLGAGNRIGHGVTLGTEPQDLSFSPERARPLVIGERNRFRENVNISAGLKSVEGTRIGNDNYFMAFSHVGHDCQVGDSNILANAATLAGHVELEDHIFLSGQVAVHQFCRIGAYAMVAGVSGVPQDVPPFALADGHRARIVGLNVVGLRRHGFSAERRRRIQAIYRLLFRSGWRLSAALAEVEARHPSPEAEQILDFVRASRRGVISYA